MFEIGIDLLKVERLRQLLIRHPKRAAERLFSPTEILYCLGKLDRKNLPPREFLWLGQTEAKLVIENFDFETLKDLPRGKSVWQRFAASFACKEAVSKAMSCGIGASLSWRDMEIRREASGKPRVEFSERGASLLKSLGFKAVKISITHSDKNAVAVALAHA